MHLCDSPASPLGYTLRAVPIQLLPVDQPRPTLCTRSRPASPSRPAPRHPGTEANDGRFHDISTPAREPTLPCLLLLRRRRRRCPGLEESPLRLRLLQEEPQAASPVVHRQVQEAEFNALLADINKGKALRKAVTNDRSAPAIAKSSSSSGPAIGGAPPVPALALAPPVPGNRARSNSDQKSAPQDVRPMDSAPQLGGLFAGGMPKLKKRGGIDTGASADASFHSDSEKAPRSGGFEEDQGAAAADWEEAASTADFSQALGQGYAASSGSSSAGPVLSCACASRSSRSSTTTASVLGTNSRITTPASAASSSICGSCTARGATAATALCRTTITFTIISSSSPTAAAATSTPWGGPFASSSSSTASFSPVTPQRPSRASIQRVVSSPYHARPQHIHLDLEWRRFFGEPASQSV
ncbi:hypothetical protein MKX07_002688 [Trichoderma sp. CBMAI-0711]|nr:hypothetical protein MKX07_002688 [Trichoderma sp. CBMAI-0711]